MSSDIGLPAVDKAKEEAADEAMRRLLIRKQNLLSEIEMLQHRPPANIEEGHDDDQPVEVDLKHESEELVLVCETHNGRSIHAIIIFAEGIFPNGESHAVHFSAPFASKRTVHFPISRNLSADLHINIIVETSDDEVFDVFEVVRSLPTFALFRHVPKSTSVMDFKVKFKLQERIQRV